MSDGITVPRWAIAVTIVGVVGVGAFALNQAQQNDQSDQAEEAVADLAEVFGADEESYQREGEEFIDTEQQIETFAGTDMTDTNCELPTSDASGTTFACESSGGDGSRWRWTVEITGVDEITVQGGEPTNEDD